MAYSRILVATDLSDASGDAAALARRVGHARSRHRVAYVRAAPWPSLSRALPVERTEERLRAWARERGLADAEIVLPAGSVARELAREARDMDADLVVVGHTGRGRAARKLLGSTARATLRHVDIDTLIARSVDGDALRHIVVATDLHPPSAAAARKAAELAKAHGATVELAHVIDPSLWYDPGVDEKARGDGWIEPEVRERLDAFLREHLTAGKATLLHGDPADALATRARETHADLLVLGDHGAGALERAMIGSAAESIVELAPCSALVVRTKG